jgi:hypothetical protein
LGIIPAVIAAAIVRASRLRRRPVLGGILLRSRVIPRPRLRLLFLVVFNFPIADDPVTEAADGVADTVFLDVGRIAMVRVDPRTRTPIGRRRNKATSLVHTYRADQWASFKATHNPTRVPNCRVPPRGG